MVIKIVKRDEVPQEEGFYLGKVVEYERLIIDCNDGVSVDARACLSMRTVTLEWRTIDTEVILSMTPEVAMDTLKALLSKCTPGFQAGIAALREADQGDESGKRKGCDG